MSENKEEANPTNTGVSSIPPTMIPIFVMGKRYEVPDTLTIMKAMEYAGFKFIRGCGCRGGICGACATVYRRAGDYKLQVGLACQTLVEPDMYLAQIPFYPANRAIYDFASLNLTLRKYLNSTRSCFAVLPAMHAPRFAPWMLKSWI